MLSKVLVAAAAFVGATRAHYSVVYPDWRGDSFEEPASQYDPPCANINTTSRTNRTEWPLDGGSVVVELGHHWDYLFVNLGLGSEVTNFNISLTPQLLNNTGNGTLCLPKLAIPAGITIQEGQNASLQFITVGQRGTGLYNCADIVFRESATILSGEQCMNTTEGPLIVVTDQTPEGAGHGDHGSMNETEDEDKPSGASLGASPALLTASFAGLMAMVVASGLL